MGFTGFCPVNPNNQSHLILKKSNLILILRIYIFLLKLLSMRALQVLLLFILSSFWQPSEALAIVQSVRPMTATTQQATPATTQKPTRIEKKLQKLAKYRAAARGGFNGDASQWLWYALGFVVISVVIGLLSATLSYLFWVIAVVCLAVWALKFFGII